MMYRKMPHGSCGLWWKVQKKCFFWWVTLTEYRSLEEAREILKELHAEGAKDAKG